MLYRTNMESEWITLTELEPAAGTGWIWTDASVDLPQGALVDGMQIGFLYDDSNEHAWGAGIDDVQLFINTTSVFDLELQNDMAIFPNPNNGIFDIQIDLEEMQEVSLSLRDFLGRIMWEEKFVPDGLKSMHKVNLGDVPKGNYQLSIKTGNQEFSKIVIIQ